MRRQIMIVAGVLLGGLHTNTWAQSSVSGTTIAMHDTNPYVMFVYVNQTPTNSPACHTAAAGNRYAIDISQTYGRVQAAEVMEAQATGRTVDIGGTGTCNVWADTDTLDYITVH